MQLVGDDLFVTNVKRLSQGIGRYSNLYLGKSESNSTLTETIEAVQMAHNNSYTCNESPIRRNRR